MRVVDLFAGLGGFTEGAEQAGHEVIFSANHWPEAVEVHARNHPGTQHACQDLHQINWNTVPKHDLLIASPACQGHSRAMNKERPYHDALRSTAWAVTTCLEVHRPGRFIVENVPEFMKWELFPVWKFSLECLGYQVTSEVLNAADFGVPQNRQRLFVVGSLDRKITLQSPGLPHRPAADIVDWDAGTWKRIETECRSQLALKQWRNGRPVWGERFLIGYHSDKSKGVPLHKPIGTITTKAQWAAVKGDHYRMFVTDEYRRAMGFREDYHLPPQKTTAVKMLGNAVPPPMARGIIAQVTAA